MKRTRSPRRSKQSPHTETLIRLSESLAQSSSRIEDAWWEKELTALIHALLTENSDTALLAALDHLYSVGGRAYDELADLVESCCESTYTKPLNGQDAVMFAAPVLAWSRQTVPSGLISNDTLTNLRVHLQAHVLAADTHLGLAAFLWSPDQLPTGYVETARLFAKLAKTALHDTHLKIDATTLPETVSFLSDTRYLIGVVTAPLGHPLFRWQEQDSDRDSVTKLWTDQGGEAIRPMMPACAMELLLPQSYHAAILDADYASRAYSLRAAIAFLQTTLNLPAAHFKAVIAPYADHQIEEYRVGFTLRNNTDVVHGVVWPLLESENETLDTPAQIDSVLREAGLGEVMILEHRFPMEFCDDCGAPLYPNPDGEPSHAELPETDNSSPRLLH